MSASDRLQKIRGEDSQREVARRLGIAVNTWRRYEAGERAPDFGVLSGLAKLGWNPTWVLTGEGEERLSPGPEADGSPPESVATATQATDEKPAPKRRSAPEPTDLSEYALVPHLSVRAAAGAGQVVESEQIVAWMAFRRTYLQMLGVPARNACLVRVRGDSMEPDLRDGDTVLVDTSDVVVRDRARIYVLRYQGSPELVVKSVKRNADGAWDVVGGPHWPRATIEADADKPLVVGRVRWSGRTWD